MSKFPIPRPTLPVPNNSIPSHTLNVSKNLASLSSISIYHIFLVAIVFILFHQQDQDEHAVLAMEFAPRPLVVKAVRHQALMNPVQTLTKPRKKEKYLALV